jgi:hypothetical protein
MTRHGAIALALPCPPQIGFRAQAVALAAWLGKSRFFWFVVALEIGLGFGIRIGVGLG